MSKFPTPHPQTFDFPEKNTERIISDADIWILSYYRSSELTGSLLMGKMARRAKDDEMRARLTWHFAEEARHAWKWTDVIRRLGADPLPITETYQSNYFTKVGIPKDDLELLAITQVFEERVARHFAVHRAREQVHPLIRERLSTMCCEEGPHVRWIREKLSDYAKNGRAKELARKMKRYATIDQRVYAKEAKKFIKLGWEIPDEVHKAEKHHEDCQDGCS